MTDKARRTSYSSCNDETPDEKRTYRFHSENSQAASWDNSEGGGHPKEWQGELQHLPGKYAESMKQKNRAGIFNGLPKRLKSRFEQLPGKWTTSSVRVTHISSDVEAGGEDTNMLHKKRAPYYRCVPNPPGCIPVEVMMRVEDVIYSPPLNRPGQGARSTAIEGTNYKEKASHDSVENRNEDVQENAAFSSNIQPSNRATKMLINSWIDPEQGC